MKPVEKVRRVLSENDLDAMIVQTRANYAWLTQGGWSAVSEWTSTGVATLVVTADRILLVANNIEIDRLVAEQCGDLTVEPVTFDWWQDSNAVLSDLTPGMRLGSDVPGPSYTDVSDALAEERSVLSDEEIIRYRNFSQTTSRAVERVLAEVKPGWSEFQIQGQVIRAALDEGIRPSLVLVGVDRRVFDFRHPVPTGSELERYAMVVLCGERDGLIANTTRFVHFGSMPAELAAKHEACATILSSTIAATTPGKSYRAVWQHIVDEYEAVGYADEWKLHHQGGPTGYASREWLLTPERSGQVRANMAFAWNPSVGGAKAEDTVLITDSGHEAITLTSDWPTMTVEIDGSKMERAAVLER